jgi:hypothetical protein
MSGQMGALSLPYGALHFVMAGLDPAIHAETTLAPPSPELFAGDEAAWTTGSSPVVTMVKPPAPSPVRL